jgi:hypothetical protein
MILPLLLAVQAAAPPADDPRLWEDPPTEMVDFLGRRLLCAQLGEPAARDAGALQEAERLQCAALPVEERAWRARYAGRPNVLRWIDRDPLDFHLNEILVSVWHGPPGALPMRIEQRGADARTGQPYHLVVDAGVDGGRSTRITASYATHAERSFTVDNARVPRLDLQSLQLMLGTHAGRDEFHVVMRYGYFRGYCQIGAEDDRPMLQLVFLADRVSGYRTDRTNCESIGSALPDAAAR